MTAAVIVAGIGAVISTIAGGRENVTELPEPTAEQPAVVVTTPAASTQTPEPTEAPVRFYLSASERDTVERVVMAEAGGESFEGQMLVAQCILNAAEKEGVQPSEAVVIYSYTSSRPDPTQSVKDAVAAVFDRGEVAIDAPVMYFYNPALVTSNWHESQYSSQRSAATDFSQKGAPRNNGDEHHLNRRRALCAERNAGEQL